MRVNKYNERHELNGMGIDTDKIFPFAKRNKRHNIFYIYFIIFYIGADGDFFSGNW
jgi:hypothetical protein